MENEQPERYATEQHLTPQEQYARFKDAVQEYMSMASSPYYAQLGELNAAIVARIETLLTFHKDNLSKDIKERWANMVDIIKRSPEVQYRYIVEFIAALHTWAASVGISVGTEVDMVKIIRAEILDKMYENAPIVSVNVIKNNGKKEPYEFSGTLKEFLEVLNHE